MAVHLAAVKAEMMAVQHYFPKSYPFAFTNSVHCSHLEVDVNTGFIKLLTHWAVEDCGTVINPQNVDDQVRGGIVQGIGGAIYEECIYNDQGQLLNGNLADYLVPMAAELPDIVVGHVESKTFESDLGAKGAGEAGTAADDAGEAAMFDLEPGEGQDEYGNFKYPTPDKSPS